MKLMIVLLIATMVVACGDEITKTNLAATITVNVSTNVVSGDNATGCNLCFDGNGHWNGSVPAVWPPANCKPYHPATERWTITNVVRRVTLATEWNGKPLSYSEETVVSSVTNRWKLASEWKKDQTSR